MLNAAIESLVQKVQCGVVINFEKFGPDPPPVNEVSRMENGQDANGSAKGFVFDPSKASDLYTFLNRKKMLTFKDLYRSILSYQY